MSTIYLMNKWIRLTANPLTTFQCKRYLFGFKNKSNIKKKEGFYILFPDIPADNSMTNELMNFPINDSTTQFSKINAEKCVKAVAKLSVTFESTIDSIERQIEEKKLGKSLDDLIKPIEEELVRLNFSLTTMRTLKNVCKSKFNFKKFDEFFERINSVKKRRFQSQPIYYVMREINSDRSALNAEQQRLVDKYLLEAKLNGTHLSHQESNALNQIHIELNKEKTIYRQKLDEATKRFTHTIDDRLLLQVFPDQLIAAIGSHSNATVTLHSSVFNPFMEYCPDRPLRWNLWNAYNSRASPATDSRLSNSINIENIRSLRKKQAKLLGYENYLELSMETKMARNADNVKSFISTLRSKSKRAFETNLKELTDFAKQTTNFESDKLELWDLPFWQRKLLQSQYSIEDTVIKQYFPLNSVLKGMFQLTETLFNVKIEEVMSGQFDAWHKDVKLFRILSPKSGIIASFFFDPFSRMNEKSSGYWNEWPLTRCDSIKTKPLSYFIMNLPKPLINGQSVQLSFTQIVTLFKQFGHILQHSLTEISYPEICGLSNLEWDVVHFCSEFYGLWPLNSYKVIASCSQHVVNGSQITEHQFNQIRQAHYHFSCMNLKHEIYRMALDLAMYSSDEFWGTITDHLWKEYMDPFIKEKTDTHPCSFRTIFCDDFSAAYFSFKWAEMLATDVFAAFQEVGLDNDEAIARVGSRFRQTFLALGGGCDSNEVFRRFLGRDPSPDALLRINGVFKHNKKKDTIIESDKISATSAEKL